METMRRALHSSTRRADYRTGRRSGCRLTASAEKVSNGLWQNLTPPLHSPAAADAKSRAVPISALLCERNTIDLHVERAEPSCGADEDAGGFVCGEILGVDHIDRRKVRRVRAIDVALHDPIESRACRLETALQMLQDAARLLVDRQNIVAAGLWINRRHARDVDPVTGAYDGRERHGN